MERNLGVVVRGIRTPIIRSGDDLIPIVIDSLVRAVEANNIVLYDRDILGITEGVVGKAEKNFALLTDIKADIESKYNREIGIVFPILSRNRFSKILAAVSSAVDKVYIQLSYPGDEVGNKLISQERLDETDLNPYSDTLTEEEFYNIFGEANQWFRL